MSTMGPTEPSEPGSVAFSTAGDATVGLSAKIEKAVEGGEDPGFVPEPLDSEAHYQRVCEAAKLGNLIESQYAQLKEGTLPKRRQVKLTEDLYQKCIGYHVENEGLKAKISNLEALIRNHGHQEQEQDQVLLKLIISKEDSAQPRAAKARSARTKGSLEAHVKKGVGAKLARERSSKHVVEIKATGSVGSGAEATMEETIEEKIEEFFDKDLSKMGDYGFRFFEKAQRSLWKWRTGRQVSDFELMDAFDLCSLGHYSIDKGAVQDLDTEEIFDKYAWNPRKKFPNHSFTRHVSGRKTKENIESSSSDEREDSAYCARVDNNSDQGELVELLEEDFEQEEEIYEENCEESSCGDLLGSNDEEDEDEEFEEEEDSNQDSDLYESVSD